MLMSMFELASLGRGYYCVKKSSDLNGRDKFGWEWSVFAAYLVKEIDHICMNGTVGPSSVVR